MNEDRWILPEGIDELLPLEATRLEQLRRKLLDQFSSWGYELVVPPFVEFLDSLLTGTGNDLDIQTFKLTDQLSGRLMGVRADMTPQVARIDAHRLGGRVAPTRLCYFGTVLHTRGDGFAGSRCPMQIGAELYGHSGVESDTEVIGLMCETIQACGIDQIYFDLGHVGLFRALARQGELSASEEALLFDALQRKAAVEIGQILAECTAPQHVREMLSALMWLNGDNAVLERARAILSRGSSAVQKALAELLALSERLQRERPDLSIHYDLAELRGYHYHTGVVFAAYTPGEGRAIALGGRYDDIGSVFGRARPATGFSTDLKLLMKLGAADVSERSAILAPAVDDDALRMRIRLLRGAGERVVCALPGQQGGAVELGCDRVLVRQNGEWIIQAISE